MWKLVGAEEHNTKCFDKFTKSMEYVGAFGFQLVQKTLNFIDYAGSVVPGDFMEDVMGKYSPSEVTLAANKFRGFSGLYRLPVLRLRVWHHS